MNGKIISIALLVVLVAIAGYVLMDKDTNLTASPSPSALATATVSPSPSRSASPSPLISAGVTLGAVKTFNVSGMPFAFSLSEMKVKKGDTVKVVFTNQQGSHDWVIDEFNARTPVVAAGKTAEVQFVANKSGTFEYYCSVGTHRQQGMKGKLIVE